MIHTYFDLQNDTGFSSSILSSTSLLSSIQKSSVRGLDVLSSGPLISDPTEVFKENKIIPIFTELKTKYDFILVDAPAFLGVADAAQLVEAVDGIILVARRGVVREDNLHTTCQQLNLADNKTIGVVINNSEVKISGKYYKHYEYKRSIMVESPALENDEATIEPSASLTGESPGEQPGID
jgi:Mrp family chromosome partitioning ATPase